MHRVLFLRRTYSPGYSRDPSPSLPPPSLSRPHARVCAWQPPPSPPPNYYAEYYLCSDEGSSLLAGLSALFWKVVYQKAVPMIRAHLEESQWWVGRGKSAQKIVLYGLGFARTTPNMDTVAADMFAWFCLAVPAHGIAGLLALPLATFGWEHVGHNTRNCFLFASVLLLGWSAFHGVDFGLRRASPSRWPEGISGLRWPVPGMLFFLVSVVYFPFWLIVVLSMNGLKPELASYHHLFCGLTLGMCFELGARSAAHEIMRTLKPQSTSPDSPILRTAGSF